jgi:hypothetical protein
VARLTTQTPGLVPDLGPLTEGPGPASKLSPAFRLPYQSGRQARVRRSPIGTPSWSLGIEPAFGCFAVMDTGLDHSDRLVSRGWSRGGPNKFVASYKFPGATLNRSTENGPTGDPGSLDPSSLIHPLLLVRQNGFLSVTMLRWEACRRIEGLQASRNYDILVKHLYCSEENTSSA